MNATQMRWLLIGLATTFVAVAATLWWYSTQTDEPTTTVSHPAPAQNLPAKALPLNPVDPLQEPEPEPNPAPATATTTQPITHEPVEPVAKVKLFDFALPPLDDSDATLLAQLKTKLVQQSLELLIDEGLIEHFVATIDAMSRQQIPYKQLPVKRPTGRYKVIESEPYSYVSTANAARYQPYLDLMSAMPLDYWVAFYQHIYPLLQQSYERLGLGEQPFHQVLLQAMSNMLATPAPTATMPLVQPNVMFEYADAKLQQSSALEKLMLRIGPTTHQKLIRLVTGFDSALKQLSL